ncbi:15-hydroxyprostaglandin dehydrogenase [Trichonephila clavipes]|nr:15-hydroxyprostaglandin dehydrogenase [Trichonephila clavipes]
MPLGSRRQRLDVSYEGLASAGKGSNPSKYGSGIRIKLDEPTNLKQPTLNHVQSDTMASAVLADPTRALQGTNRVREPAMEESENDVGSLEQLLLYADEHYLAGKLHLGDHLGKVLHGVIINVTLAH